MPEGDRPHSDEPPERRLLPRIAKVRGRSPRRAGAARRRGLRARPRRGRAAASDRARPAAGPGRRRAAAGAGPAGAGDTAARSPARCPAASLDPAAVRRALGGLLDDPRLGRRVGVAVAGLDGRPVLTDGPGVVTPASTLKLLTCLAALETLGPEHRFTTSVVAAGRDVTLVGGGDPLLASEPADDDELPGAGRPGDAGAGDRRGSCCATGSAGSGSRYDDSLFTGPAASPGWEADYLPDDVVSPITALWVDEGAASAGRRRALRGPVRRRRGRVRRRAASPSGWTVVGAVGSGRRRRRRAGGRLRAGRRAGRGRPARAGGQRQRGRRGAGPARRARRGAAGLVRRPQDARSPTWCDRLGRPGAGRRGARRQRPGAGGPARRTHAARGARGRRRARGAGARRPSSRGCRSPGSAGRSATASPTTPTRRSAGCAPRPAR